MMEEPEEQGSETALERPLDVDGEELSEEALEELATLAEAEVTVEEAEQVAQAERLAEAAHELEAQRAQTNAAVARYREAVLAAEPDLPPELVSGETLEEVEASLEAARRAVAQIRERLGAEEEAPPGGFPAGAPARARRSTASMSAAEKIAYGLEQPARSN